MRIVSILAGVCMMATTLAAAGIDGEWEATVQSPGGEQQYTFVFEADEETLTGTVDGGRGGESPILDGMIDGDEVSFRQQTGFGERKTYFVYSGKLAGDSIEFRRKTEGGAADGRETTFTATRVE